MNKMILFGVALVFFGFVLLLKSLDIVDFSMSEFFGYLWPMALIILGIALIVRRRKQDDLIEGIDPIDFSVRQAAEQAAQSAQAAAAAATRMADDISASVSNATSSFQQKTESTDSAGNQHRSHSYSYSSSANGHTGKGKYSKVLGDLTIDLSGQSLHSNQISTILGDLEVRLHGGLLEDGLNRMLISGFLGDIRVNAPASFEISVQASNFIGDLELLGRKTDGLANSACIQTPDYAGAQKRLHIAVNTFLGDVRIIQL